MAVEGGAKCVKYMLFFFNFIFWAPYFKLTTKPLMAIYLYELTAGFSHLVRLHKFTFAPTPYMLPVIMLCGLALIVLGILVHVSFINTAILRGYTGSPVLIIIVGVVIFFIAFFGCCGAWKENQCMVTMFAVLLSLIIVAEIGGAIAGYVLREKLPDLVDESFKVMIKHYNTTEEDRKSLDYIQEKLKCCGGNSSSDWVNFSSTHKTVPDSCCINITKDCGVGAINDDKKIYVNGCKPGLEKFLRDNILWLAVGALIIAFLQITGVVLSCILMRAIRSGYEVM